MFGMIRTTAVALLLFAGAVVGTGCDDPKAQTGGQAAPAAAATADPLPAGLIVDKAPADAKGVTEVRGSADGEDVVVRGRIAGSQEPFTAGRAQFQLIDLGIKSCAEMEDDSCPTPWDMCCEEPKVVAQNSVTVQVVGADGRPLKSEIEGVAGLKPLSEVAVKGKLRKSADGKAVTVDATELHVKQG